MLLLNGDIRKKVDCNWYDKKAYYTYGKWMLSTQYSVEQFKLKIISVHSLSLVIGDAYFELIAIVYTGLSFVAYVYLFLLTVW